MKKLISILLMALISGGLNAKDELIPLETFAKHSKFKNMSISPTGKYLAFTYEEGSEVKLAVMERKTKKITAGFADGENRHVRRFRWLNDERLSILTQTVIGWLDGTDPKTAWIAANANGKKRKSLMKQRSRVQIISTLDSDPKNVLVTKSHWADEGKVKLHKMNIYTGKMKYIDDVPASAKYTKPGIVGIGVDLNDKVRFAYEFDQGKDEIDDKDDVVSLHYKNQAGSKWKKLTINSKRARPNMNLLGMSGNNDKFYFTSNHDMKNADTLGLFEFDFNTRSIKLLYRHEDANISSPIVGNSDQIIGVSLEAGYPINYYIENDFNAKEIAFRRSISSTFKGQEAFIISSTDDSEVSVIRTYSDTDPGQFYLYNSKASSLSLQGKSMPEINPALMAKVEPFSFEARDGLKIYGQLTIPKNVEQKKLPMVVFPHGGPYGANDNWRWDERPQMFASRGYLVLQVNFRGSGGYGQDFREAGNGEYGLKMIDDITDATNWAINSGIADANRVCIHGVSYGGYATGMSVVREPDLYKCGIPDAGFYDMKLQWTKADSFGSNSDAREWFYEEMMGENWKTSFDTHSTIPKLSNLKAALLIVHGTEDERVPVINAYELEKELKALGKSYETMYRADGHGFQKEKYRVELYEKMLEFLEKHIGPGATPKS